MFEYKLRRVIDYIESHLDQDLSLVKLAAIAQMSPYYFARLFKQSIGAPPHQYLTTCRIEKAKQLLANKDLSILEITQQIGLQSQSHFTNLFRRSVGVTPSAYRERL
jgi:AraC family transcriptional regulator